MPIFCGSTQGSKPPPVPELDPLDPLEPLDPLDPLELLVQHEPNAKTSQRPVPSLNRFA